MKTILVDAIHAFVIETEKDHFQVFEAMHGMLETFPNKKIILTGANDEQFIKFGLDKMPYEVFTLKHDPEKTNPEYYRILLNRYNLSVEEVIYFEHNPEAAASAQSIGIQTYVWDDSKKPLQELKAFLKQNI